MGNTADLFQDIEKLAKEMLDKYSGGDEFWEEFPVDIETFVCSEDYLSWKDSIYPGILNLLREALQRGDDGWLKYNECIVIAGQGCGKSQFSSITILYIVYLLLCMRNPQKFFGLAEDSRLQIINCAPSEDQAFKVVFGYTVNHVNNCGWFKRKNYLPDPNVKSELRFPKGIYVTPGSSSAKPALGHNLLVTVFDEVTSFDKTAVVDSARELYNQLWGRMNKRFWGKELFVGISTANTEDDFIEERFKECERDPRKYCKRMTIWESKPFLFKNEFFDYDVKDVSGNTIKTIKVPIELKSELEKNPVAFLRDVCGIPSLARSPFIKDFASVLSTISLTKVNPLPEVGWEENGYGNPLPFSPIDALSRLRSINFGGESGYEYVVGLDLSKGVRDKCGFALVHRKGDRSITKFDKDGKPYVVDLPIIELDLVTRFVVKPEQELNFGEIRELIFALRNEMGFNIKLIVSDSYESIDFKQIMLQSGFDFVVFGTDAHRETFDSFLEAVLDGRFIWFKHDPLLYELQRLEDLVKKVDHPTTSGKDLSDALVLASYFASGRKLLKGKVIESVPNRNITPVISVGLGGGDVGGSNINIPNPLDKILR